MAVQAWSFLGDLVRDREEWERLGGFEAEDVEHLDDVGSDAKVVDLRATDLVMAKLESDGQPVPAPVGEPNVKGPHDIVLGHAFWLGCVELGNRAGEAAPSCCELVAELVEVIVEGDRARPRSIEVGGESTARFTNAQFQGGAALHDAGRKHLADDGVGDGPLDSPYGPAELVGEVVDSLLERPEVRRRSFPLRGHAVASSAAMTRLVSLRRMRPRSAASRPASRSRSGITIPRQSSSARATVADGIPS